MSLIAEILAANLAFVVVALGSGDVVLGWAERWTRAQSRPPSLERAGIAVLVGFGTCAYVGLLLAALGLFRGAAFVVCGMTLAVLTRRRLAGYARSARKGVAARGRPGALVIVCAAAALVVAGAQWLAALAPPEATDELAYHLPEARTLADGHVIRLMLGDDHIYGNLPALMETLYGEALSVRGTALAHALHLSVVFAFLLLTAGVVRRLWGGRAAALAVLGILLYGDLTYNATTAYVDAAASGFEVGAVLLGVAWLTERQDGDAVAAALLIGLALAVKYTAATSVVALLLLVGLALVRERRYALLARLGALVLAGCAYWYGKNLARFGNPVFPFALGHPGVTDETYRYFVQTVHAYGRRTVTDFARVPLRFADDGNATAYLGFALSPLALAARGPRRAAALLLAYVVGYTACWYWLESNQVRFLMSAAVAAIVLAAAAFGAARGVVGAAVAVAVAAVLIAAAQIDSHDFTLNLRDASRSWLTTEKAGYVLGLESTHHYLERYFGCQVDAVDALAARHLSGNVALWDLSPPPDYPRHNRLEPIKITATTTAGAAAQLRARGIRFALAQGMPVEQLSSNVVTRPLLRRAIPFWHLGDCTLYRLPA
jgi:4-amino-4-deoxy-L-arabinose transferase-like glycosyltransferase